MSRVRLRPLGLACAALGLACSRWGEDADSNTTYWSRMWQNGAPAAKVAALDWFAKCYLRTNMPLSQVEAALGLGERGTDGYYSYVEPKSDAHLYLSYREVDGREVVASINFVPPANDRRSKPR